MTRITVHPHGIVSEGAQLEAFAYALDLVRDPSRAPQQGSVYCDRFVGDDAVARVNVNAFGTLTVHVYARFSAKGY